MNRLHPEFRRKAANALLAAVLIVLCGCEAKTPRILIVGDSWAFLMGWQRSLNTVMAQDGHEEYTDYMSIRHLTAVPGYTAKALARNRFGVLHNVGRALRAQPSIDIVHLSIGGNDGIALWSPILSREEEGKIMDEVIANTRTIIEYILAQRPNLRVVLCGYDYMDYRTRHVPPRIYNAASVRLGARMIALAQSIDRCEYVNNFGLMQYMYGYPGIFDDEDNPVVYLPHELPFPGNADTDYVPLAGGDINYPSPPNTLSYSPLASTSIQLNRSGYEYIARNCMNQYYAEWLDNPLTAE